MKNIFVNIIGTYKKFAYLKEIYKELYEKNNIKIKIFYEKTSKDIPENSEFLEYFKYENFEEIKEKIIKFGLENILYINNSGELSVLETNKLKKDLGFAFTEKYEIFRNKNLQRKYLLENFSETTVNFQEINLFFEEKIKINFPCIIKPTSGVQSSGVAFLKEKDDLKDYKKSLKNISENLFLKGFENQKFILEEFIDGEMYTINYFVNDFSEVFFLPIVKVKSIQELGINDFSNYVRIYENFDYEIDKNEVYDFVKKHIKTFGIKNTFVHHEFKKTSSGLLKTIELNGRIGGYRMELYKENFGINMFDLVIKQKSLDFDSKNNYAAFVFYPEKNGILEGFNEELLQKFKSLKSYFNFMGGAKKGKNIGLTKDGFSSIASLKLKNSDKVQFKKDFDFVEKNYKNLIILK